MGAHSYEDLRNHIGHKIVCVAYSDGENEQSPANVAVECETCNEVLMDFDKYTHTMIPLAVPISQKYAGATGLQIDAIEHMARTRNYTITKDLDKMSFDEAADLIRKLNRTAIGQDNEEIL